MTRISNEQAIRQMEDRGYVLFEMGDTISGIYMIEGYAAAKKDVIYTAKTLQALNEKIKSNLLPEEIGTK